MKADKRNFAIGHFSTLLAFAPGNAQLQENDAGAFLLEGFRTSLQYYVLTWDGTITRWYINGKLAGEKKVDWTSDTWSPDAALFLGNQADSQHSYLGTFYLAAIHDRCFAADEVVHNYQTGPGGK